jgi:hypothetical protein
MRTIIKNYKAALMLIVLLAIVLYAGTSSDGLHALAPITPIPSTDSGPQFITDLNNALNLLQQNQITATPQVLAPTVTDLGNVSGAVTCNVAQSSGCRMTLTAPVTSFSLSGGTAGQLITLQIVQGATGGASFAWPASVQWQGPAPATNPTPGATQLYELQTFDGVTWYPLVHSSLSGNAITGTGYLPSITNFNGIVQGALNVMAYGATGSTTSVTATTTAGSTAVTLNSPGDFQNGQHVVIMHLGAATALATPAAPIVKTFAEGLGGTSTSIGPPAEWNTGCNTDSSGTKYSNPNCTTSYTFQIAEMDANGGISAPGPVTTITNGPATPSAQNRILIYWPVQSGAVQDLLYGCAGASCTPTLMAVLPAPQSSVWTTYLNVFIGGLSGNYNAFWYMGGSPAGAMEAYLSGVGTGVPASAVNQNLYTTIASGAGTTSITLANAATLSGSAGMYHDDAPPIQAAINAACGGSSSAGGARQIFIPPGAYVLGETLNFNACISARLTCPAGTSLLFSPYNCVMNWVGSGPIVSLSNAGGDVIEGFTFPGAATSADTYSTPAVAIDIEDVSNGAGNSTDTVKDVYIGHSGYGIAIGLNGVNYLGEKMYFENVQMANAPSSNTSTSYIGYYIANTNSLLDKIERGMVADRAIGIFDAHNTGALRVDNLNDEGNIIDVYETTTTGGATGYGQLNESAIYSEFAQHHYYATSVSTPVFYHLTDSNLQTVGNQTPNLFYLILGAGGAVNLANNWFCTTDGPCLVAMYPSSVGIDLRNATGRLTSSNNLWGGNYMPSDGNGNLTPFWPAPALGTAQGGPGQAMVVSINDMVQTGSGFNYTPSVAVPISGIYATIPDHSLVSTFVAAASLPTPAPPTVTVVGTAGTTTHTYYVAAVDAGNNMTMNASAQITNSNATLSTTNYNSLSTQPIPGARSYRWWRDSTYLGQSPIPQLNDVGQSVTPAYGIPFQTQQGFVSGSILNSCSGSATLSSGSATVNNACIGGSRPILLAPVNDTNHVYVASEGAGTFTIKSTSSTDSAFVYWSQN